MPKVTIADVLDMSPAERILLVEEIWDSLANVPESVEITPAQREELERRVSLYRADPTAGSPWEVVKQRILSGQ